MENFCLREYSKFQYLFTLFTNIEILYNQIIQIIKIIHNQSIEHQIHGGLNLVNSIDKNILMKIAHIVKNKNMCDVLQLLYTNDVDIVFKDQSNMNNFIICLSEIFHEYALDRNSCINLNQSEFHDYVQNNLSLPKIKTNNETINLFSMHMKSLLCSYLKTSHDDSEILYKITTLPHSINTQNDFLYKIGELMFFNAVIKDNDNKTYKYCLCDLHISKTFIYEDFAKYDYIEKFLYEYKYYFDFTIEKLKNSTKIKEHQINNITNTDKTVIFRFNDDIIEELCEQDKKIKFRLSRMLLYANLFFINGNANLGRIRDIILNANFDVNKFIIDAESIIVKFIKLAYSVRTDIYYFENDDIIKVDDNNFNYYLNFMFNGIQNGINTIIQNCKNLNISLAQIDIDTPLNILFNNFCSSVVSNSNLTKYEEDLKIYDLASSNVIKEYTGSYYTTIITYLRQRLFENNNIINHNYNKDLYNIFHISRELTNKYNNIIFDNEDYFYVVRGENFMSFENYYNYFTLPIGKEFTHPFPLSTSISIHGKFDKNITLKIKINKNSIFCLLFNYSTHRYEREVLLPPGTQFKILNKTEIQSEKIIIDLEIIGNLLTIEECDNIENYINYYKTNYIFNKEYFRIKNDKMLLCNVNNVNKYIKKLYNAVYSNTVPMQFQSDDAQRIIKGYLFRKNIINMNDSEQKYKHPLYIEIKLLELTKKLLEQNKSPHIINSYGRIMNCKSHPFYLYVKKKLCNNTERNLGNSWICNLSASEAEFSQRYYENMSFVSLEFADMGTLTNILREEKIKNIEELYEVYFQIFYTLSVLHYYYNFVHFDLKPDNIMFVSDKNYDANIKKHYKYSYCGNDFYIPVKEYIVKIADYDASFYCNVNNIFISNDSYHFNKIKDLEFGKIDVYMIFHLLSENMYVLDKIKKLSNDSTGGNKIIEIYNSISNFSIVPPITQILKNNKICNIDIFSYLKNIPANSSEIFEYKHYENIFLNLKQTPMQIKNDTKIGHNLLSISNENYNTSLEKMNNLRNNIHVLRIMTFNVHEWKDSKNNVNYEKMIIDIINVFPDILCLQEDKIGLPHNYINSKIQNPTLNLFDLHYKKINHCNADNNLINSIYIKKTIENRVIHSETLNIGKNTSTNDAQNRCATKITYINNKNEQIDIINVHLHYSNINDDAKKNIVNLVENIKTSNKIILGDFNNYNKKDLANDNLKNQFDIAKGRYNEGDKSFEICEYLENEGMFDAYELYLNDINYQDRYKYKPLNTTRFGGRIDHIYLPDNFKILGVYKLYSESSDHSPIIIDLLDDQNFNNSTNLKFSEYVKNTAVEKKSVEIDVLLDDKQNNEEIKEIQASKKNNYYKNNTILNLIKQQIKKKTNPDDDIDYNNNVNDYDDRNDYDDGNNYDNDNYSNNEDVYDDYADYDDHDDDDEKNKYYGDYDYE